MMEMKVFGEFELSQLMLGTVQFGLNYGIANTTGQPSYETARDILACAVEGGVNCLDTAAIYGSSEEVLGRALHELGVAEKMVVVSKIVPLAEDYSSAAEVDLLVEESVVTSLKRLKLERLPMCLFHREENFRYVDSLLKLRDKGLIGHVGCSVMSPAASLEIVRSGQAEAVQVPTSVLDRRFTDTGVFREAKSRGMGVFVRSVYLQGLVLMEEDRVLPELAEVKPVLRRLRELAAEAGMTLTQLAARYVLGLEGQTCTVVGVETVEQMRENIELFEKGPLERELFEAVVAAVPELPEKILSPTHWSKRMADVKPARR
jgi:aryl-alcohol dehydrogenase-like predicted oxidoreductase